MIDPTARERAAELLGQYRDAILENERLHSEFATLVRSEDRAISAVKSMLWSVSDHSRQHALVGADALNEEGYPLFDRCILFLRSGHEYEWPQDQFDRTTGFIPIVHWFTFGLSWLYSRWALRKYERLYEEVRSAGEFEVWPFIRRADFDQAARFSGETRRS